MEFSYGELLERVKAEYDLNSKKLNKLTGIPEEIIDHDPDDFPEDIKEKHMKEYHHLTSVFAFLAERCQIDEDDYLRAHLNNLMVTYDISKEAISKFTGIDPEFIDRFLQGNDTPDTEEKYKLAVRFLFMEWLLTKNPYVDL